MEERIPQNENIEKPKGKYWRSVIAFLIIILVAGGVFFIWDKYFSPQAKLARQTQENYQKYLDESNFKEK